MGKINNHKFIFFVLAPTGTGLSGGDRIFIELARQWSKLLSVTLYTTQEGIDMLNRQHLSGEYLEIKKVDKCKLPTNFFLKYLFKIYLGIRLGQSLQLPPTNEHLTIYLYSSSDFWMDVLPALLVKARYKSSRWFAAWFQTPLPGGFSQAGALAFQLLYWLSRPRPLIAKYANM
jgi:hypothetical protein